MTGARELLLAVTEVTVRFGGVVANDGVSVGVHEGEIAALIGPNGAGKTTLFNVVSGMQRADAGRIVFDGTDVTAFGVARRARLGMARTFQNLALVSSLSALDNVTVGLARFCRGGLARTLFRPLASRDQDRRVRRVAAAALAFVGIEGAAGIPAGDLSYGDCRRLELARALALEPRILLLDEPSAGMSPGETVELAATLRRVRDQLGIAILVVEHDMAFVRLVADRTTVLDFGRVLASGPTDEVLESRAVVEAYLGTLEATHA